MMSFSSFKKKFVSAVAGATVLSLSLAGVAAAVTTTPATNTKSHNHVVVTIPEKAVQVADNVFSLGSTIDAQSGEVVEGYMIIHYKKVNGNLGPKVNAASRPTACYGYLGRDTKWKNVEPWIMNPANTRGLDGIAVRTLMQNSIGKWEDATDGVINGVASADILGSGSTTSASLTADSSAPDNQNEVFFAQIADANAIAVTTVWGIFSGPTYNRKIVEWDMVFDDVKFDWSTAGSPTKMDFESIATHELGHAVGMADLYNSCTEETMYGYASEGETKKQSLNTGDIQGINSLY